MAHFSFEVPQEKHLRSKGKPPVFTSECCFSTIVNSKKWGSLALLFKIICNWGMLPLFFILYGSWDTRKRNIFEFFKFQMINSGLFVVVFWHKSLYKMKWRWLNIMGKGRRVTWAWRKREIKETHLSPHPTPFLQSAYLNRIDLRDQYGCGECSVVIVMAQLPFSDMAPMDTARSREISISVWHSALFQNVPWSVCPHLKWPSR